MAAYTQTSSAAQDRVGGKVDTSHGHRPRVGEFDFKQKRLVGFLPQPLYYRPADAAAAHMVESGEMLDIKKFARVPCRNEAGYTPTTLIITQSKAGTIQIDK